jgi:hypothetical protein
MNILLPYILKNGIWWTLPPLFFSLGLMAIAPTALTATEFNAGIPNILLWGEIVGRVFVFATPLFFTIGLVTKTQKIGFCLYLFGVTAYCLTYGIQNYLPDSLWSTTLIGFTASAYTNLVWMVGLGLMGQQFYPPIRLRYRPILYIAPATIFIMLHVAHLIIYFQLNL